MVANGLGYEGKGISMRDNKRAPSAADLTAPKADVEKRGDDPAAGRVTDLEAVHIIGRAGILAALLDARAGRTVSYDAARVDVPAAIDAARRGMI